jgi:GTP pyrophosphokinase/guanosine-3',5'-bis(diphosphate) 3'-pyrophosphohydrolase
MPQATWLDIATTGKARTAIRRALREMDRERYVKLGAQLAIAAFEQVGKKSNDKTLGLAAKHFRLKDKDEVLARLGSAELTGSEVVQAVYPELVPEEANEISSDRAVIGLSADQSFQRAECCQPLPGERIVGITYRGQGVVVHAIDCDSLSNYEDQPDRWLDLHWHSGKYKPSFEVKVWVTIGNDAGVLGRICTLIGENGANISDLEFVDQKPDFYRLLISVELADAEHLHKLMLALEAENDVAEISRYRNPEEARAPSGT